VRILPIQPTKKLQKHPSNNNKNSENIGIEPFGSPQKIMKE
jgi:hypothetical protein